MTINPTVDAYIAGVLDGSIVVSQWIKKAIKRHLRWLKRDDIYFDVDSANAVIDFIQKFCIPPDQETPMVLYDAQQTMLALVYGWKKANGYRLTRRFFWLVSKKNGKSGCAASLCIFHLIADAELSPRCFTAATGKRQARIVFQDAVDMIDRNPELKAMIHKTGDKEVTALYTDELGRLSPLTRSAQTEDGKIVSFSVIDEVHRMTSLGLWTLLKVGGRTRNQPLMACISTAGETAGDTSIVWNEFDYCCKILDGYIDDDEVLPWLFVLDEKDDYKDPANWPKSNPAIGHLFDLETIVKEFHESQGKPSVLGDFKRYSLNIFSDDGVDPAVDIDLWDACGSEPLSTYPDKKRLRADLIEKLAGRPCFAGIDLAPKNDTSALVLLFPPTKTDEKWEILEYFWIPKANIADRVKRDRVPYDIWANDGYLITTQGIVDDFTDVQFICDSLVELSKKFNIKEVAYDPAHSPELVRLLASAPDFPFSKLVPFPQNFPKMNGACQDLVRKIKYREFGHSHNPVMRWQMKNLRWRKHKGAEMVMPDKSSRREKIDGCSALVMALARAIDPANVIKPKKVFKVFTSSN
jgi:phage terminase large subunit-like protein